LKASSKVFALPSSSAIKDFHCVKKSLSPGIVASSFELILGYPIVQAPKARSLIASVTIFVVR